MSNTVNPEFSFLKGWNKVLQKDAKEVREKLMCALCITTNPGFLLRLRGRVEPKVSEAAAIEAVFAEYGITDIWGVE